MKKFTLIVAWLFYLIAASIILFEIIVKSEILPSWKVLSVGVLVLTIPWLICFIHAIKKSAHFFWIFAIFTSGFVAIPFYLIRQTRAYVLTGASKQS